MSRRSLPGKDARTDRKVARRTARRASHRDKYADQRATAEDREMSDRLVGLAARFNGEEVHRA